MENQIMDLTKANWVDPPDHLLADIMDLLVDMKDYIRFRAVCKPWQCLHLQNPYHRPRGLETRQLPFLMLPETSSQTCSFYSLPDPRILDSFRVEFPDNESMILNSTEGWLVITSRRNQSCITLFNPFLVVGNKIELPPLPSSPGHEKFLRMVVLSANPSSSSHYVVIGMYGHSARSISDLHCLSSEAVCVFDVTDPCPQATVKPPPGLYSCNNYLVNCFGDLLLIRRRPKIRRRENTDYWYSSRFEVLKFNVFGQKWYEVKTLGDKTVFLGRNNSSIVVLSSNFQGCKGNRIYFIGGGAHYIGIFNMKDGSIETLHSPVTETYPSLPIWIEPTEL